MFFFKIRQNEYYVDIKGNIYQTENIVYFIFFLVQTSKTVFRWIIVQDDKNSIPSLKLFFFVNVYIGQFVVNETNICLRLSPVSWQFEKKNTTVSTVTLTNIIICFVLFCLCVFQGVFTKSGNKIEMCFLVQYSNNYTFTVKRAVLDYFLYIYIHNCILLYCLIHMGVLCNK